MITFKIGGSLPASYEDFFGSNGMHITIYTINSLDEDEMIDLKDEDEKVVFDEDDGWYDVYIKDNVVTEKRALGILSRICNNNIVRIISDSVCQSVTL